MVTGIVCTEVRGSADQRLEVTGVKRSLKAGVRKISRTGVRTPAGQVAYGNKYGRSLLKSMRKMESDLLALQKQVDDQQHEHTKSTKVLTESTKALAEEVIVLRPLKETAVEIRKRFFATYRRKHEEKKADDQSTILSANLKAHAGDVCLDVVLFKNKLIEYQETFSTLYGLSWSEAESLFVHKKLILAMNTRATIFTNTGLWWYPDRDVAFRKLLKWIRKATDDDLEKFDNNDDESFYPQGLLNTILEVEDKLEVEGKLEASLKAANCEADP